MEGENCRYDKRMVMDALYGKQQVSRRRPPFEKLVKHFFPRNKGKEQEPEQNGELSPGPGSRKFHLSSRGRVVLQFSLLALFSAAVILLYLGTSFEQHPLPSLPVEEHGRVREDLLSYVSYDNANQGSGGFMVPENAIISAVSSREYLLQRGDTLSEIAHNNGLDVGTLIAFNEIKDVRRIFAGTTIKIPNVDGVPYTVQKGDSLASIAEEHGVHLNAILDANDLQSEIISNGQVLFIPGGQINEYDYKKAMGTLFLYPTRGRLTSPFGYRNDPFTGVRSMHYGIDLAAPLGTDIISTMSGTVIAVGDRPSGYGKYVVIRHNHGFQSLYGHLSRISVRKGQYIYQGQKIGEMGNSGRSTGPHLHFALYRNNVPVNPLGGYLYR